MADDDPIISELEITLSPQPTSYLHLVQYGVRPPLSSSTDLPYLSGRFKKNSRYIELELPLRTDHPTYCKAQAEELAQAAKSGNIRLASDQYPVKSESKTPALTSIKYSGGPVPYPEH